MKIYDNQRCVLLFISFPSYPSSCATVPLQHSSRGFKTKYASRRFYGDVVASEHTAQLRMSELDTPCNVTLPAKTLPLCHPKPHSGTNLNAC